MRRLEESPLLNRPLSQSDAERLYDTYPLLSRTHRQGCPSCGKNDGPSDGILDLNGEKWRCNCHDQLQRQKHYLNAGVGQLYQFLGWDDFTGDKDAIAVVREYAEGIRIQVESGRGMLLRGTDYGTGKTFSATLIARAAVMAGFPTFMMTFPDLLASMKAGWRDAEYDKWRRHKVESAAVLILDDVGKELLGQNGGGSGGSNFNNEFAQQTLDNLVRTRIQQGRPTIITTNLTMNNLTGAYGMALQSLLKEMGETVEFGGADFRTSTRPPIIGKRRIW